MEQGEALKSFPFNLIYFYICYKRGEEVWDNISSSKAGNESQTAPLFWTHFFLALSS